MKNRKVFTLIIHGTGSPVHTKKYIPVCISLYLGQIRGLVDNKINLLTIMPLFHHKTKAPDEGFLGIGFRVLDSLFESV